MARRNVLLIGIDGLGGFHMEQEAERLRERMPTLHRMMSEAMVSTLHGRTVYPPISAPAWAAALTGMAPDCTGIVRKAWDPAAMPAAVVRPGTAIPWNVFDAASQQGHNVFTTMATSWSWLLKLVDPTVCSVMMDAQGDDVVAVERFHEASTRDDGTAMHGLAFVHLDWVDAAGHKDGWESTAYRKSWTIADGHLHRIIQIAAEYSTRVDRELVVLVASDHGGSGFDHGDLLMSHMQIPLVLWSPRPAFLSEQRLRRNTLERAFLSIVDVAPTLMALLGLPIPMWLSGQPWLVQDV